MPDKFTVAKPFNTATRRLAALVDVTESDLADDAMTVGDRVAGGWLTPAQGLPAPHGDESAADDEPKPSSRRAAR